MVERLWEWSGEGALPIVIDAASCTGSIVEPGEGTLSEANAEHLAKLTILDSVAWAHDRLLPGLEVTRKVGAAAIHPTCATHRQGHATRLGALAAALADDVYLPPTGTCCGFAGDRGISHPELTAAATRTEASEIAAAERSPGAGAIVVAERSDRSGASSAARGASVHPGRDFDAYLSSNRTCEIGLTRATGREYESVINALERATR
jgi:D-lactate dehydrogenase